MKEDLQNIEWSKTKSKNSFGYKFLKQLGWNDGEGVGKEKGIVSHLHIPKKVDMLGIGAEDASSSWLENVQSFSSVLDKLNKKENDSPSPSPSPSPSDLNVTPIPRISHKKRMKNHNPNNYTSEDIDLLFGRPCISSSPSPVLIPSPSTSPFPTSPFPSSSSFMTSSASTHSGVDQNSTLTYMDNIKLNENSEEIGSGNKKIESLKEMDENDLKKKKKSKREKKKESGNEEEKKNKQFEKKEEEVGKLFKKKKRKRDESHDSSKIEGDDVKGRKRKKKKE